MKSMYKKTKSGLIFRKGNGTEQKISESTECGKVNIVLWNSEYIFIRVYMCHIITFVYVLLCITEQDIMGHGGKRDYGQKGYYVWIFKVGRNNLM